MRKELRVRTQPYRSQVIDFLKANPKSIHMCKLKGWVVNIPTDLMWAMAKSTGLKSNKTRHIKKRAKILLNTIIREFVTNETDTSSN